MGNSGFSAYEIGDDFIKIQFSDASKTCTYRIERPVTVLSQYRLLLLFFVDELFFVNEKPLSKTGIKGSI